MSATVRVRIAVEDAGIRWICARDERDRLEEQRNAIMCVYELERENEYRVVFIYGQACWKKHFKPMGEDGSAWVTNRDPKDWCEECKLRAEIHAQYVKARHRATSMRGALTRACDAAARKSKVTP